MKRGFIYGSIIAVVGLIIVGIAFIVGGVNVFDIDAERVEKQYTFSGEYAEIQLSQINEDIVVKPSTDEFIHLKTTESEEEYYQIVEGDDLKIEFVDEAPWINKFFTVEIGDSNPTTELYLPENMQSKLYINNTNGEIEISDVGAGAIEVEDRNSDIVINNVSSLGDFTIYNQNGDIDVDNIESQNLVIENENDDILSKDISSNEVEMKNTNGEINFENMNVSKSLKISNVNDKVEGSLLGVEDDYSFEMYSKNGETKLNDREVVGTSGNGVVEVKVDNTNDDIELNTK